MESSNHIASKELHTIKKNHLHWISCPTSKTLVLVVHHTHLIGESSAKRILNNVYINNKQHQATKAKAKIKNKIMALYADSTMICHRKAGTLQIQCQKQLYIDGIVTCRTKLSMLNMLYHGNSKWHIWRVRLL